MPAVSKRERVLIVLAVGAAIVVGGYVYLVEPLRERAQEAAELIPAREAKLDRRRALIAQRDALAAELAEADRRLAAERERMLRGPTPPLAASELQKLVKDVATEANVEVRSERILPTIDRAGIVEVPVEITVAGGIRESVDLLHSLERTPKLLTLQDVKIRVISVGQPRDLLTTLTIAGYLLPEPEGARGPAPPGKAPESPPGVRAPERTEQRRAEPRDAGAPGTPRPSRPLTGRN
jgi:Tfp pilus assembly protein PilO